MIARLRARQEWALAGALRRADGRLTTAWWEGILLRGTLPAVLAVASGWLIAAITDGTSTAGPLLTFGAVFVISQVIGPLHEAVGYNLGDRTSTSLNDRLMAVTLAPPGIAHLERADLSADLTMARDFDLGITGAARDGAASGRITVSCRTAFSTVRMAELILVLDGAHVVEVGGHDELVARGGQYAELFGLQATAYR